MKIQVAVDYTDISASLELIDEVAGCADIVEIGTPLMLSAGASLVSLIKEKYPQLTVLADAKIIDGGTAEARMLLEAGADIITVMAITNDDTIRNVVRCTKEMGRECLADMMLVSNIGQRSGELEEMGVDYICAHTAFDVQHSKASPLAELRAIKENVRKARTAIAGGINPDNVAAVAKEKPDIVIAGGFICKSSDKAAALALLRERMA